MWIWLVSRFRQIAHEIQDITVEENRLYGERSSIHWVEKLTVESARRTPPSHVRPELTTSTSISPVVPQARSTIYSEISPTPPNDEPHDLPRRQESQMIVSIPPLSMSTPLQHSPESVNSLSGQLAAEYFNRQNNRPQMLYSQSVAGLQPQFIAPQMPRFHLNQTQKYVKRKRLSQYV
jgi:hypothetical protein